MDNRLFFVIGDLVVNVAIGLLAGALSWAIIDTGWNMIGAMVVMMVLGMALAFPVFIIAAVKLGAMEVMVPVMFSGMLAGMVVGMAAAMMPLSLTQALQMGGGTGLAGIAVIWILNSALRGVRPNA